MIGSLFVGMTLAAAYFYSMQWASFNKAGRSISSGLLGSLGGFFLRLFFLTLILIGLARETPLHVTGVVAAFMIVFLVLLFWAAGKVFLSDLKKRPPTRSV